MTWQARLLSSLDAVKASDVTGTCEATTPYKYPVCQRHAYYSRAMPRRGVCEGVVCAILDGWAVSCDEQIARVRPQLNKSTPLKGHLNWILLNIAMGGVTYTHVQVLA